MDLNYATVLAWKLRGQELGHVVTIECEKNHCAFRTQVKTLLKRLDAVDYLGRVLIKRVYFLDVAFVNV